MDPASQVPTQVQLRPGLALPGLRTTAVMGALGLAPERLPDIHVANTAGCHPGDWHYVTGNYRTRRRFALLQSMFEALDLNTQRRKKKSPQQLVLGGPFYSRPRRKAGTSVGA